MSTVSGEFMRKFFLSLRSKDALKDTVFRALFSVISSEKSVEKRLVAAVV